MTETHVRNAQRTQTGMRMSKRDERNFIFLHPLLEFWPRQTNLDRFGQPIEAFARFAKFIRNEQEMQPGRIESQMTFRLRLPFHLKDARVDSVGNYLNSRISEQRAFAGLVGEEFRG